jgi:hypothetical protein
VAAGCPKEETCKAKDGAKAREKCTNTRKIVTMTIRVNVSYIRPYRRYICHRGFPRSPRFAKPFRRTNEVAEYEASVEATRDNEILRSESITQSRLMGPMGVWRISKDARAISLRTIEADWLGLCPCMTHGCGPPDGLGNSEMGASDMIHTVTTKDVASDNLQFQSEHRYSSDVRT